MKINRKRNKTRKNKNTESSGILPRRFPLQGESDSSLYMNGGYSKQHPKVDGFVDQIKERLAVTISGLLKGITKKIIARETRCFPKEIKTIVIDKLGTVVGNLAKDASIKSLNVGEKALFALPAAGNIGSAVAAVDTAVAAARNVITNITEIKNTIMDVKEKLDVVKQAAQNKIAMAEEIKKKAEESALPPPVKLGGSVSATRKSLAERTHKSINQFQIRNKTHDIIDRTHKSISQFHNTTRKLRPI